MAESSILRAIIIALSNGKARLFRNNNGFLKDARGVYVHFGLGTGTSDLIGWKTIEIMPEMLGTKVAVFLAIEVKTRIGKPTKEQESFIIAVKNAGGIAGIARSTEEAQQLISSKI